MRQMQFFTLLLFSLLLTSLATAQTPECEALQAKVQKRLQGKGIQNYVLEWVDTATPTKGRVVGRCSKSQRKLVYSRNAANKPSTVLAGSSVAPTTDALALTLALAPAPVETPPETAPVPVLVIMPPAPPAPTEAQASAQVQGLIQSLHASTGAFAANMQALTDRADATAPLIAAYYAAPYDATFRFNIMVLLNQKLKSKKLSPTDTDAVTQCLLDSLKDSSALVRGEALWGLGVSRNKKFAPAANELLQDPDPSVRSEAAATARLLR